MTNNIIDCDLHDYIEIACIFNIEIELTTIEGKEYKGIPQTTSIDEKKIEQLILKQTYNSLEISLPLMQLKKMTALTKNYHFSDINFN